MSTRWKLLFVFLLISLIPVLIMHGNGQRSMGRLSHDLGDRSKAALVNRASMELKRMVEDHARVLKRERELVEMALSTQAAELEKILTNRTEKNENLTPVSDSESEDLRSSGFSMARNHARMHKNSGLKDLQVSYENQTIEVPEKEKISEAVQAVSELRRMLPVYIAVKEKHQNLIFWQYSVLDSGVSSIYPAIEDQGKVFHISKSPWYSQAKRENRIVWSGPQPDYVTGGLFLTAATPIHKLDGSFAGVTAISVPVDAFLHENEHVKNLSNNVSSMLIRAEKSGNGWGIQISAHDGDRSKDQAHFMAPKEKQWLGIPPGREADALVEDLVKKRPGVRIAAYKGQESLLAYGPTDEQGTSLLLIIPKNDIIQEALAMEQYVEEKTDEQVIVTGVVLFSVVIVMILASFVLSGSLTKNVRKIVDASRRLAMGDFSARSGIRSADEMGELGKAFDAMVPELEERVKIKKTLGVAMDVQQNLLPQKDPEIEGLDVAGASIYCDETGGDYFDYISIYGPSGPLPGFVVGDVTGHGIPSALLMASARAFIRQRAALEGSAANVVTDVNRQLILDVGDSGRFMTLFLLIVDKANHLLRWVRAGHDPALVYTPRTDSFENLLGAGPLLGVIKTDCYEENTHPYEQGQIILLATDGLWEACNPEGEMFGKERVREIIRKNPSAQAKQILDSLFQAAKDFRQNQAQEDDITLVVIKILPE